MKKGDFFCDRIAAPTLPRKGRGRPQAKPSIIEATGDGTARVYLNDPELFAVIDVKDVQIVAGYAWYPRRAQGALVYARRSGSRKEMHQMLMPEAQQVDHKDGNGLNNRRSNLRPSTQTQNRWNSRKFVRKCSSRYKGVRWHRGRWVAAIAANGKRSNLGRFTSEEAAAKAYDSAAVKLHGEFARVNFPKETKRA